MPPRVLVCDDAPGFRIVMVTALEAAELETVGPACSWDEAIEIAAAEKPDAVVADLWMPTYDPEQMSRLCAAAPDALVFVVSVLPVDEAWRQVEGTGSVTDVFSKRTSTREIAARVQEALAARGVQA